MRNIWPLVRTLIITVLLLPYFSSSFGQSSQRLNTEQLDFLSDSITSAWMMIGPNDRPVQTREEFTDFISKFSEDELILTDAIYKNIMSASEAYGQVMLIIRLTNTYKRYGLLNKSIEITDCAIDISARLNDPSLLVRLYRFKAFILTEDMNRRDHEALTLLLDALEVQEKIGDKGNLLSITKNLADYHFNYGDEKRAMTLYEEVIENGEGLIDNVGVVDSWNAIGLIHRRNGRYEDALIYFKRAIDIAKKRNMPVWLGILNGNIGDTYFLMGKYDLATPLLKADLVTSKEYKISENLSKIYRNLGQISVDLGELERADFYLTRAIEEAQSNLQYGVLAEVYKIMGEKYAKEGQVINSMNYHLKSLYLKDSLNTINNSRDRRVAEIDRLYNLRDKEKYEAKLIEESEQKSIVIQKQKLWVLGICFMAIIISGILILQYITARRKRLVNLKLREQYAIILEQKDEIQQFNKNLEKEVALRTRELNEMNFELQRYAFMNAHKVRGPLASILGLFYILKNRLYHQGEESEIIDKAMLEAERMDVVISKINRKLESMNLKKS